LLNRLQRLHSKGYIHGDIKPQNMCLEKHKDSFKVCLIDFGLATRYCSDDGVHFPHQKGSTFSGNLPFASLGSCRLYTKSRKDDFESVFYILIYLLNEYKLPWDSLLEISSSRRSESRHIDEYLDRRLKFNVVQETVRILPRNCRELLKKAYSLPFDQAPPYSHFRHALGKLNRKYGRLINEKVKKNEPNKQVFKVKWQLNESDIDEEDEESKEPNEIDTKQDKKKDQKI